MILANQIDVDTLSDDQVRDLLSSIWAIEDKERYGKFDAMFPETGPYRRELYAKHMEFLEASAKYREICAMAANRIGKTFGMGGYAITCHLTGLYPKWWPGRRFVSPVRAWAAGKTNETTRDIVQTVLLGDIGFEGQRKFVDGSGLVPRNLIDRTAGGLSWKQGVADLVDTVKIRHVSGGWSKLGLKSYQQGRGAFEGTAQHVIWLDEEAPMDVYGECLVRTATTNGIIMLTYTPLSGLSDVVLQFLPASMQPGADDVLTDADGYHVTDLSFGAKGDDE